MPEISRRKPVLKNRVAPEIEQAVVEFALEQPAWGQFGVANELKRRGMTIPERACSLHSCDSATSTPVTSSTGYMENEGQVAGRQLAKAGYRLAALINQIWSTTKSSAAASQ